MKKYLIPAFLVMALLVGAGIMAGNDFSGADNTVNKIADQYAKEVGAGQRDPIINTQKGDLLLFVFGFGGAAGGFYLGYQWRGIFEKKEG